MPVFIHNGFGAVEGLGGMFLSPPEAKNMELFFLLSSCMMDRNDGCPVVQLYIMYQFLGIRARNWKMGEDHDPATRTRLEWLLRSSSGRLL